MSNDINIQAIQTLDTPQSLIDRLKTPPKVAEFINKTRNEIRDIIDRKDRRQLCIVGPCSIHNIEEALEYGKKLKKIAEKVKDKMLIVMRVYFEKPRTTIGWKGLINDPHLDGSCRVNYGLYLARRLLLDLNQLEMPCGYEILDTITPQYISDLISWGAIGARTTESQVHRQLISGVSMPVGFKNGTRGDIKMAADAVLSASYPHCFMGITKEGRAAICKTKGNPCCHIILRGGKEGPNYFPPDIVKAVQIARDAGIREAIMIDCSHGNSGKDHTQQPAILRNIMDQAKRNEKIIGIMMESNLHAGNQCLIKGQPLQYGTSITDSCLDIAETETCLIEAHHILTPAPLVQAYPRLP